MTDMNCQHDQESDTHTAITNTSTSSPSSRGVGATHEESDNRQPQSLAGYIINALSRLGRSLINDNLQTVVTAAELPNISREEVVDDGDDIEEPQNAFSDGDDDSDDSTFEPIAEPLDDDDDGGDSDSDNCSYLSDEEDSEVEVCENAIPTFEASVYFDTAGHMDNDLMALYTGKPNRAPSKMTVIRRPKNLNVHNILELAKCEPDIVRPDNCKLWFEHTNIVVSLKTREVRAKHCFVLVPRGCKDKPITVYGSHCLIVANYAQIVFSKGARNSVFYINSDMPPQFKSDRIRVGGVHLMNNSCRELYNITLENGKHIESRMLAAADACTK